MVLIPRLTIVTIFFTFYQVIASPPILLFPPLSYLLNLSLLKRLRNSAFGLKRFILPVVVPTLVRPSKSSNNVSQILQFVFLVNSSLLT